MWSAVCRTKCSEFIFFNMLVAEAKGIKKRWLQKVNRYNGMDYDKSNVVIQVQVLIVSRH